MTRQKVTDPTLLSQLGKSPRQKVTDPNLLSQLNSDEEQTEDPGAYLDSLPKPEGFFSKLPRNILAGLASMGRSTANIPHDISQKVLQGIGSTVSSFIPDASNENIAEFANKIPSIPEYNYAQMLGQKGEGTLSDRIIQKGVEYAPEIASGKALIKAGLHKFPISQKGAARQLKEAEKLINERGINNFQMSRELLKETAPFLPTTHATKEMLQGVMKGEYSPSFALQSQIGQHSRNLSKSPLASERLLSPQAKELKQLVLHEMEQSLRSTGHHKEADLLKGGIEDYAKYMKFREKALPVLKKLGIPTTGLAFLGLSTNKGRKIATKLLE